VQLSTGPYCSSGQNKKCWLFLLFSACFTKLRGNFQTYFYYSALAMKGFFLHFLNWDEHNLGISKLFCHVGFQDLLMNLAPVNSNGMIHVSSHPTPASQDPPSDPPSLTFEQYHSPLVNAYYGPNYATLHSNTGQWKNFVSVHEPNYGSDYQSFLYCNLLLAEPKVCILTMVLKKNTSFYQENVWLN